MKLPTIEKVTIPLTSAHTKSAQDLHNIFVDLANRYNELGEDEAATIFCTLAATFADASHREFTYMCGEYSRYRLIKMLEERLGGADLDEWIYGTYED